MFRVRVQDCTQFVRVTYPKQPHVAGGIGSLDADIVAVEHRQEIGEVLRKAPQGHMNASCVGDEVGC